MTLPKENRKDGEIERESESVSVAIDHYAKAMMQGNGATPKEPELCVWDVYIHTAYGKSHLHKLTISSALQSGDTCFPPVQFL
jgi:hypothetical protein